MRDYRDITPVITVLLGYLYSESTFYWRGQEGSSQLIVAVVGHIGIQGFGTNLEDGLIAYYPSQGNTNDASRFRNNGTVQVV